MTTPQGVWDFNPAGYGAGAVMYTGPMLFPAGIDPGTTQTAVIVLGPAGGVIEIPPLAEGQPGQSPQLTMGPVSTLPAGSSATATLEQTSPGAAGVASQYTLSFGLPQGATGPAFATQLISASDLTGTPSAGYTMAYVPQNGSTPAQFAYAAMPFAAVYTVTGIQATGATAGNIRTLTQLSVPAQALSWVPIVFSNVVVTGTVNTAVGVVARLGGAAGSSSGVQVGYARPVPGAVVGANPWPMQVIPDFGTNALPGGQATVPKDTAVVLNLNCEQVAATTDQYSTAAGASFTVGVLPVSIS